MTSSVKFIVNEFDLTGYIHHVTIEGGHSDLIYVDGALVEGRRNPLEVTVYFKRTDNNLNDFLFDTLGKILPFQLQNRRGSILFQGGDFPASSDIPYCFMTTGKVQEDGASGLRK